MSKRPKISSDKSAELNDEPRVTIFHLDLHVWKNIVEYMSENDCIAMSGACKKFQRIVHNTKRRFNLNKNYRLDADTFLNYALSKSCTSIDINYCAWLKPCAINEMISKTNLRHFHIIQCKINEDCISSICNLQLESFSFTYTKKWRLYFIENARHCLPFSQTLTQLEVECCSFSILKSKTYIYDVYMNVLPHCKQLQRLKLFDDVDNEKMLLFDLYNERAEPSEFPLQSTPLPNLTSLELGGRNTDWNLDLVNFVKAILQDKVIPISNVDFGGFTCKLLRDGILFHPLLLPSTSRFILRSYECGWIDLNEFEGQAYDSYGEKFSNWLGRTSYETILLDNIKFGNFPHFAYKIVSTSRKSIKELYLLNCLFYEDGIFQGLEIFAFNCPQITVLHLTIRCNVPVGETRNHPSINEVIVNALAHFKNLKELVIPPTYLRCNYTKEDGSRYIQVMPFWKVIQSCGHTLNKICLMISDDDCYIPTIHADNIYDISRCENLKVLQLNRFVIEGNEDFKFSEITKWCPKLEHLSIVNITMNSNYFLNFDDCLSYLKDLKILRIKNEKRFSTETFLNSLLYCKHLENINFRFTGDLIEHRRDAIKLITVLQKLKNLFVFELDFEQEDAIIDKWVISFIDESMKERPAFYASLRNGEK